MTGIEKRRANRLLVMNAIYEATDGSEDILVSGRELLGSLGLSGQEIGDACNYLEGENLITVSRSMGGPVAWDVSITHWGIKEMEQSLSEPTESTPHFPPAMSIIHIEGNVIGSPIQSGSPGARQEVTSEINLGDVRDFLSQLEKAAPSLNLPDDKDQELKAEIATLKAQVDSPKPKKGIIRESLSSIRSILEGTGGALVATGLLDIIPHIHI
jgi:hypothetical protein